jgi:hypothetical protein
MCCHETTMQADTDLKRVRIWRSNFGEDVDIHEERNVFTREKFGTDVPTPLFPAALRSRALLKIRNKQCEIVG